MKLQTLTVIFIIIMLPITMVVSQYIKTEISTINLQTDYDTKLTNATYDALKAFQLNESNSTTENITTEKMRDVEASVKSFYNSLASSMGVSGYNEEDLSPYIPCLVYTLYDGYYIYTKNSTTGKYELKPYVYYTENILGNGKKYTISYTLDSYMMITITDNSGTTTKSGYLYSGPISNEKETLRANVVFNDELKYNVPYIYKNFTGQSIKYYHINNEWYSVGTDGKLKKETYKQYLSELGNNEQDDSYSKYTNENTSFTNFVKSELVGLTNENGEKTDYLDIGGKGGNPDDYASPFNEHRRNVIQKSIKSNIEATLLAYGGGKTGAYEFQMPELKETEWDKIINNVSLISFMQGLPLKNKFYKGYSVVTNIQSREFVDPDEIYIIQGNQYHKITWTNYTQEPITGVYRNIDFNEKKFSETSSKYYLPHSEIACYESIVTSTNIYKGEIDGTTGTIITSAMQQALNQLGDNVKNAYYKALYRERYVNYKSLNFGNN